MNLSYPQAEVFESFIGTGYLFINQNLSASAACCIIQASEEIAVITGIFLCLSIRQVCTFLIVPASDMTSGSSIQPMSKFSSWGEMYSIYHS